MRGLSNNQTFEVAKISRAGRTVTTEPMRFLFPYQAKREAQAKNPALCHHNCRPNDYAGRR